ncbi:MAG: hypothetical protein ACOZAN_03890 [Patescibacteria group bacterium]
MNQQQTRESLSWWPERVETVRVADEVAQGFGGPVGPNIVRQIIKKAMYHDMRGMLGHEEARIGLD